MNYIKKLYCVSQARWFTNVSRREKYENRRVRDLSKTILNVYQIIRSYLEYDIKQRELYLIQDNGE